MMLDVRFSPIASGSLESPPEIDETRDDGTPDGGTDRVETARPRAASLLDAADDAPDADAPAPDPGPSQIADNDSAGAAVPQPRAGSAPPTLPPTPNQARIDAERGIETEVSSLQDAFSNRLSIRDMADGATATFPPAKAGGTPEFGAKTRVFFVNGIQTSGDRAAAEATMLASRMHQPVTLVYVHGGTIQADLKNCLTETFDPTRGQQNPPERALSDNIISTIDAGQQAHIVGFSRGALVTQLALTNVRDHYKAAGHDDAWIEKNVMSKITVETFNGASHHMPEGVRAKHYVGDTDLLVGQTIGMGPNAPAIRYGVATAIDTVADPIESLFAKANDLPPSQRQAAERDFDNLLSDTGRLSMDTIASNPTTLATTLAGNMPGDTLRVARDLYHLQSELSPLPIDGPGAAELRRDGYGNTPNGPIVHVPVYHDLPHAFRPTWFIDQHDFPAMLLSRRPFNQGT
jgi:hypothetical protein